MIVKVSKNRYVTTQNIKTLQSVVEDWSKFIEDFKSPKVYSLDYKEYYKMLNEFYVLESRKETLTDDEKTRRKYLKAEIDKLKFFGGYYFGGEFLRGDRNKGVLSKSLVTLDIDNIEENVDFLRLVTTNEFLSQYEYIIHSTAKHRPPNHKRYRLIIPLEEELIEDIALKYECITRHIANLIMDISKFDNTAFVDNHLMLYPVIARDTPSKYYTFYHNKTEKFLNPNTILGQYNYHDRYTFQGIDRPSAPEQPPTAPKMYPSSDSLISSYEKETIKSYLPYELQEQGINCPTDMNSHNKKFGCLCGSSDANNFYHGYVCHCFSSNHDSRLGHPDKNRGGYIYDIFDLYAYNHNLDTSRDFIKIAFELSKKYNIRLDKAEEIERFLNPISAKEDFKDVGIYNWDGKEIPSIGGDVTAHQDGNGENSTIEVTEEQAEIKLKLPPLPKYIREKINEKTGELTYTLNTETLADTIRRCYKFILVKYANDRQAKPDFYLYEHGVYKLKSLEELKAFIKAYFLEPYKYYNSSFIDTKYIIKVCNSLYTDYFKFVDSTELNQDENVINFKNGLLYLDTMELKPHNPAIYSTIQISCNYNPTNTNSPIFNDYMNTLTDGNENIKRVLLEVMGIAISNIKGFKMKKALFMIGKGDTGKSQLRLLTNRLIGWENTSGIDLDTLEERFGTSAIYQKRIVGSADMGFMSVKQLKTFKQITGGDAINCEFKGGAFFSYIFDGVVWFSANEMPRFGGDKGPWVYDRMIIAKCDNVIPKEKQDKNLVDKMHQEGEAIVNILIPHIKDVINNGYEYHVPEECIANREEYKKENSLVKLFLDECTEPRKIYDGCTTKKMYDVFKAWCGDNARGYVPTNQEFRKELATIYGVNDIKELQKCVKGSYYYIFTLTQSTKKDYAKAYGYDSIDFEKAT